jgi:hypothetical protein
LVVPSLPDGFTDGAIDGEPCCAAGGFPVVIDPATAAEIALDLFHPIDAAAEDADTDGDGLTDAAEVALGTNAFLADSDGDELSDGDEVDIYGTDALAPDTDHDGLDDAAELLTAGTNPFLADTDGDGSTDTHEVAAGTDPLDAAGFPIDPSLAAATLRSSIQ